MGAGGTTDQFADIAIILIHLLDVTMHNFQRDQFIIRAIATGNEEQ